MLLHKLAMILVLPAGLLSSFAFARSINPPCPPPPDAVTHCLSGSLVIELQVASPGKFKARAYDVQPQSFHPWAQCIVEHAAFFYFKEIQVPGKHRMPITFNPGECSGPDNSFKPNPLRGSA